MKRVLVVEDDKFLGNAYRVKLTKAGFDVEIALDGNEAMAAVKKTAPDLILLDLVMPVKDGFSTLSDLKADPKTKNIPVIIASNLGQKEDIDRGMKLGAIDFIVKTDLSMDKLITKIGSQLK